MKTLFLDFTLRGSVYLRITGLSFKVFDNRNMCRDEWGKYYFSLRSWDVDPVTAKPKIKYIIDNIAPLMGVLPFYKIKINGYYPHTAEEIFALCKKENEPYQIMKTKKPPKNK